MSIPLKLTSGQIEGMPKHTVPVTLECAGNNRTDLEPAVPGNKFQCGAISTAIWGGVSLRNVLEQAGVGPEATEVLFEGGDVGEPEPDYGQTAYLRSLPLEVAMHPDTLLAYEMNGEALAPDHGHPLRLIVPGWYAMASVKWLRAIRVIDYSFEEHHHLILKKVPEELDLGQLLQDHQPPSQGVDEVAFVGAPRAGEVMNVAFTEPLQPGRYVLLCYPLDPKHDEGTQPLAEGIAAAFTVR